MTYSKRLRTSRSMPLMPSAVNNQSSDDSDIELCSQESMLLLLLLDIAIEHPSKRNHEKSREPSCVSYPCLPPVGLYSCALYCGSFTLATWRFTLATWRRLLIRLPFHSKSDASFHYHRASRYLFHCLPTKFQFYSLTIVGLAWCVILVS